MDGIDISGETITFAKMHYPGPRYVCADLAKLPERSIDHDLVVAFEILEHLADPKVFLRLVQCKTMIASVPNEELYPFNAEAFKEDEYPHQRHYTPEQFEALLLEAGFETTYRYCQRSKEDCAVRPGTDGKFLIYVAEPK